MRQLILTGPARRDLLEIHAFLSEAAGEPIARDMVIRIHDRLDLIRTRPGLGHRREDLVPADLRIWTVPPYLIVYQHDDKHLVVIRIIHSARDIRELLISDP